MGKFFKLTELQGLSSKNHERNVSFCRELSALSLSLLGASFVVNYFNLLN